MLWSVVLLPALAGVLAILIPVRGFRRALLPATALVHAGAVVRLCMASAAPREGAWIALDAPGRLFLAITSALFLGAAVYAAGDLRASGERAPRAAGERLPFADDPEGVFIGCLLLFLASMSLVCVCQHLGLLWVAVEATTLAGAPLISFHRHGRSLEAAWKYLLICSVGIAIALLGVFVMAAAGRGHVHGLTFPALVASAAALDPVWLRASFLLLLVGFGTKMGLAPMHTWLPDAHSEAPPVVSSLLSGALLNCAFLGLFRGHAVLAAAELGHFSGGLLVLFGLLSMSLAALFMIGQTDFKRMLAYSSIEHMGILALGAGLGGLAATGAMLHAVGHSAAKSLLFLTAGNLVAVYRTKNIREVRGALRGLPVSGCLWLAGFLAIAGAPPFGLFLSELTILRGAIDGGHWTAAALFLAALGVACTAMAGLVLPMVFGSPVFPAEGGAGPCGAAREPAWAVAPPLALGLAVLALGLYVPGPLWDTLREAAAVGGR